MPQIILWEEYVMKRRQWLVTSIFIAVVSLCAVAVMLHQTMAQVQGHLNFQQSKDPKMLELYADYKMKEDIYKILRSSGMELGDAMEIAQTVIDQSKKTGIPVAMFLALMKKESNFSVDARSPVNAMGIMQIHPITWDSYARKLNLPVSRDKAFEPSLNISVASAILTDLKERYEKAGMKGVQLWDYILSAYYAGPESVKEGLNDNHRQYVERVRKYVRELSISIES